MEKKIYVLMEDKYDWSGNNVIGREPIVVSEDYDAIIEYKARRVWSEGVDDCETYEDCLAKCRRWYRDDIEEIPFITKS